MKKIIIFLVMLTATSAVFARGVECPVPADKYQEVATIMISNLDGKTKFSVPKGELEFELASIDSRLTLLSKVASKATNWTTYLYEGTNNDDTRFLITVTIDESANARVNIQTLVDGLEGGTNSMSLECSAK
jgi:hypothetical protein